MRKGITVMCGLAIAIAAAVTSYAGEWKADNGGWWYQNDDGSYAVSGWQWIDGNKDGIAESYYFNEKGYILSSCMTPDGYYVNEDGAWAANGTVQTKNIGGEAVSFDRALVDQTFYINGTGEEAMQIYFNITQSGDIVFDIVRMDGYDVLGISNLTVVNQNTLNFRDDSIGWDINLVWEDFSEYPHFKVVGNSCGIIANGENFGVPIPWAN